MSRNVKRIAWIVAGLAGVALLIAGGKLAYYMLRYPIALPIPKVAIARTPETIERGRYLAHNVTACFWCHSRADRRYFSHPEVPGTDGAGDPVPLDLGPDGGKIYMNNITPAAIGDYTDGELVRVITTGMGKHDRVLLPVMPYERYASLSEEDAEAIVAYLRTLAPIPNTVPQRAVAFRLDLFFRDFTQPYVPHPTPNRKDTVAYGKYLATIGVCMDCHTIETGEETKPASGGHEFPVENGIVRSANLTPDVETGIGRWSEDAFVARFRAYARPEARQIPIPKGGMNTIMPWTHFAEMKEEDLRAIYTYLRTLEPARNLVVPFTPNPPAAKPSRG